APVVAEETVLRVPSQGDERRARCGPLPVGAAVDRIGELTDLGLDRVRAVEIRVAGEDAGEQQGGGDRRELDLLEPLPRGQVEECRGLDRIERDRWGWRAFGVVRDAGGECTSRVRGHEPTTHGGAEEAADGGGARTHPGQKSTWVPSCRRLPSVITQPGFPKSLFVFGGVGMKLLMHPKFW